MTPVIFGVALSLVALDSSPATAPPAGAPPAAKPAATSNAGDPQDRVVCRRQAVTGSRFEQRVCMTQGQWDERARQAQQFIDQENQRANAHASGGLSGG